MLRLLSIIEVYLPNACFPNIKVQKVYLNNFVGAANEGVEQTIYVRRIRFRIIGTLEGSLIFAECGGEDEAMATCNKDNDLTAVSFVYQFSWEHEMLLA